MKKIRTALIILVVIAVALVLPILLSRERLQMNDAARASVPGSFAVLSDGTVHYELSGPAGGHVVVFICGFSVPMYLWDGTFEAMAAAGFRVLRYDLFGRGYSDRPRAVYNRALYIRQLSELLYAEGLDAPVDLVGVSMGGSIAAAFSEAHPGRVRRLVLMAPGPSSPQPFEARVMTLPVLGDWFFAAFGPVFLPSGQASDFHDRKNIPPLYMERYRRQAEYRGFSPAILSTLRNLYPPGYMDVFAGVGARKKPVLLLWGTEDTTVPFANSRSILELIPGAEFHAIPDAGHLTHIEKPDAVLALMKEFLGR